MDEAALPLHQIPTREDETVEYISSSEVNKQDSAQAFSTDHRPKSHDPSAPSKISVDPRIDSLVAKWEAAWKSGENPPVDELCRDFPQLKEAVGRRIDAIQDLAFFLRSDPRHDSNQPSNKFEFFTRKPDIPGYTIHEQLGRGGMDIVYRAKHQQLNRIVALKMVSAGVYACEEDLARFMTEAESVAQLQHENVVRLFDFGQTDNLPYFTLEFVSGGTLADKAKAKRYSVREAAAIVEQLARGVRHAHGHGIVHRDLKPQNILLTTDGTPKITDFGLAKRLAARGGMTATDAVMGTPGYMSPEQASGSNSEVGPSTDIYSLGVILYELLTGSAPFKGNSVVDTLKRVCNDEAIPPSRLQPKVHRDVETICLKCLQKNPTHRYEDAESLAEDLKRFLDGEPIQARPIGRTERIWRWCGRNPALAGLSLLATAAILLLIPVGLWLYVESKARQTESRLRKAAEQAAVAAKKAERAQRLQYQAAQKNARLARELAATQEYHALLNQAGKLIVEKPLGWTWTGLDLIEKAANLDTQARDYVNLRSQAASCFAGVDIQKKQVLKKHFPALVRFSPDGKTVAAGQFRVALINTAFTNGSVILLDAQTGKEIRALHFPPDLESLFTSRPDGIRSLVFSPDGSKIAAGSRSGWLHYWELSKETPKAISQKLTKDVNHTIDYLAFSPDSEHLFIGCDEEECIWSWSTQDKKLLRKSGRLVSLNGFTLSRDGKTLFVATRAGSNHCLQEMDSATLKASAPVVDHTVRNPTMCSDGKLAAFESDFAIHLVETSDWTAIKTLRDPNLDRAHVERPSHVQFSSDGSLLMSATTSESERTVRLWEVSSGRLLATLVAGENDFIDACLSPDGHSLAVNADNQVVLHEVSGRKGQVFVAPHTEAVSSVRFSGDGETFACMAENEITVWNTELENLLRCIAFNSGHLMALHPDGESIAAAKDIHSRGIALLDVHSDKVTNAEASASDQISFSPDGKTLWAIDELSLKAWKWPELSNDFKWKNLDFTGRGSIKSFCVGRKWVLAGGRDGGTRLFKIGNETPLKILVGPGSPVLSLAMNPEETLAVIGTQEGLVRLVELPSGKSTDLVNHSNSVEAVAFNADGSILATGSMDKQVQLYKKTPAGYRQWLTLRMPGPVVDVQFHPDGKRLAVILQRGHAVRIWHLDRLNERLDYLQLNSDF